MSGSLLRCLQEAAPVVRSKATLMQQKLPVFFFRLFPPKYIYGFLANYQTFSSGGEFSALQIFTVLLIVLIRVAPRL